MREPHSPLVRCVAALGTVAALALTAGCGGDDDDDTAAADTAEPAETAATSAAAATAPATEPSSDGTTSADEATATFPVTVEHAYGETTVEAEPERVVVIGFGEHDSVLALGVTPIAVRDWYGEQPFATWPWAQDELGDAEPEVLPSTELNFEQIAALDPDLIVGINSGITESDYDTLSAIAPTVARPADTTDYGTPWRDGLRQIATAVGKSDEAETIIGDLEARFAEIREEHPEFDGASAAVSFVFENQPGAYASTDIRAATLAEIGFTTPPEFDELAGDQFFFSVSPEELDALDTDVVVWLSGDELSAEGIRSLALRPSMPFYIEGRELAADFMLSGAFSHASPLSLEYALDALVPELALAVDGDPSTVVPSAADIAIDGAGTTSTPASTEMTEEEQSAADAWALVFDSSVGFDEKSAHIEDAAALQETIDTYATTGETMGGISLVPTGSVVDGESATITYDVMFGESPA